MARPDSAGLTARIEEARRSLDAHVREIVRWHFDPETGSPFWLERAKALDFDPREEIRGYDDLRRLGHFQDEWLRGGPVRRWLPRGLADQPVFVFETGGSTGVPKSRINVRDFEVDYEIFGANLPEEGFPRGADWLMLGPTGPRRLRLAIEHLAQHRGGICFFVDLDPRWVNRLVRDRKHHELEAYKEHVINQAMKILRAHDSIHCLFTTPKLLDALAQRAPIDRLGITGIFCGGTEMTAQFNRFVREELAPGAAFVPTYGNTLMGLACPKPFDPADGYAITYYPPAPRAVFEIVDPDEPEKTVPYGATGRVMLTTLTREFFMPRFLERDEGERAAPCDAFPWDGVANLRLLSSLQTSVVVGVY
jgi:phenylacetate-coenzyme A ligase PaaK-like adenylate-forming protein